MKKVLFCIIDNKSGKESFNGEYQDLQELVDDIKDELGILLNLSDKSYIII